MITFDYGNKAVWSTFFCYSRNNFDPSLQKWRLDFRIGIVAGIALHIGMLIYNQNSPNIVVEEVDTYSVKVTLEHGIAFPVCEVKPETSCQD